MIRITKLLTMLLMVAVLACGTVACKKKPKDMTSVGRAGSGMTNGARNGAPDATTLDGSNGSGINGTHNGMNPDGLGNPENSMNAVEGRPVAELPNVYFALDSDELDGAATAVVDNGAGYLKKEKALYVVLRGHCDDTGTAEYNVALGSRRAQRVRDALIERGIDANRLQTLSFGKEMPAVQGTDEASRAQNRRVEFFVFTQ
ncbi:OmpA family protein [Candidatus Sumerlaeota bacterium]|nr:OmpA family protein [Candidatus Sumerlaeota bacterium]